MSEQNKNNVRRLFEEVWNKGNMSVTDELFSSNCNHHDSSTLDVGRGPESEKKESDPLPQCIPRHSLHDRGNPWRRRNRSGSPVLAGYS